MDSEPLPPPSYKAATAASPTDPLRGLRPPNPSHTPPFAAPGANTPSVASGPAWRRSQAVLSTRYGASGREDMVSRAEQERAALLRTSGGTRCVVQGLKRTASQEKLAKDEWKITQDKIRKRQERQVRERELEREKRNRELEEREAQRAAWAKETEEAREQMEAEQKVWKKKWPWQRWGNKSPKKRYQQEEEAGLEERKKVQRGWNRADGKVEFRPMASAWSGPQYMGPTQPALAPRVVHHHHHNRGGGGGDFLGGMMGLALGIGMCDN